jgi:hypothetical protein
MARKRSKRGSKASAARSKRKGKARAAPTERRAQPKGVINAWEDDPGAGNQPSGGQVIQRPIPVLRDQPLPIRIVHPARAPEAKPHAPGTTEFRYWTAAEALRRRCLLASATIRLASTANPSPPTNRCRGSAHDGHVKTPSDLGSCPRSRAHKTSGRRGSTVHPGMAPSELRAACRSGGQSESGFSCRDPRLSRPVLFGLAWKPIFCPDSTPPCHWAGKSGGVVCLRMSSATRRRRAPKRSRVRRYSISSSAYALWPPLRLWPFSPARHFKDIARRLVDRRAYFNRIHVVDPRHARGAVLQAQMLNASSATIPIPIVSTASATGS